MHLVSKDLQDHKVRKESRALKVLQAYKELKAYKKWAEHRILRSDYE